MKSMVYRYRFSKFKRFTNGLLFAVISIVALILCVMDISGNTASRVKAILPFTIASISMLMGFVTMFYQPDHPTRKEKL